MRLIDESNQPHSGVLDALGDEQRMMVQLLAAWILECFEGGDWESARLVWEEAELDADETIACWGFFTDSRQRAYLKREDRSYLKDDA